MWNYVQKNDKIEVYNMEGQSWKGKHKMPKLLERPFTSQNTFPASKLREISQRKLKELVEENAIMGLIIKDEMALTMMGMKDYEDLLKYIESLEQMVEEAMLIKDFSKEVFETPHEQFIEMPENMSAKEYREWRKGMKS